MADTKEIQALRKAVDAHAKILTAVRAVPGQVRDDDDDDRNEAAK